jgi:hypothetical protein
MCDVSLLVRVKQVTIVAVSEYFIPLLQFSYFFVGLFNNVA